MARTLYLRQLLGCIWEDDASLLSKHILCTLEDISEWLLSKIWVDQNFPPKKRSLLIQDRVFLRVTATPRWEQPGSMESLPHTHFLLFLPLTPTDTAQAFKEITSTGLIELLSYHNWDLGVGTGMSKGHRVINEYTTAPGISLLCLLQTFSKLCVDNAQQIRLLRKSKSTSFMSSQNSSVNESGSLSCILWDSSKFSEWKVQQISKLAHTQEMAVY